MQIRFRSRRAPSTDSISTCLAFALAASVAALPACGSTAAGDDPAPTPDASTDATAPVADGGAAHDAAPPKDAADATAHDAEADAEPVIDAGADAVGEVDDADDASVSAADASVSDAATEGGTVVLDASPPAPTCNGAASLCAKRFDEVAYVTSHNSMSNGDDHFLAPNQNRSITRQLEGGVRALMLDTYSYMGSTYLCHGYCELGSKPLATGLGEIGAFLNAHPREIVSIIFESYISAADTRTAFVAAGLEPMLDTQSANAAWPTLDTMIASGKRLVVFTDSGGGAYPWYHPVWDFAWETPYAYKTAAEMQCVKNRGTAGNRLFIFNHFLTNPVASELLARQVNFNPFLAQRAATCRTTFNQLPNFITVDFEDVGDVVAVVRSLNGLP